ncbi:SnoaL-like domain-containing protein [Flavobacterium segetis]|uniref:SnoaL-like domain-containing protein n=1 Tax=Flavobacterium segetis TaxID=271157 RepID=A0A1M5FCM0_9FLAO|nr:nuclear transport factor 2 family protein [Flavobacterium segetis]SHF89246.1 SnoaL-like domain-containing protein [Flavobacterium segetis]
MKKIIIFLVLLSLWSCKSIELKTVNAEKNVNSTIDDWHVAAATANYDDYFNLMTADAVFIGTDATENWNKEAFQSYAKPHFDKGKAWSFTTLERHIFFDKTGNLAWFDELLNTQMKICRGSGVLVKKGKEWKIKQYVLSMTVPNENSSEIIKLKSNSEDAIIRKMQIKN